MAAEEEDEEVEFIVFDSTSFKDPVSRKEQPVLLLKGKVKKDSGAGYSSASWPDIPAGLDQYMFTRLTVRSCAKKAKLEFHLTKEPHIGELALQFYIDWDDSRPNPLDRCYDSSRYFVLTFAPTAAHATAGKFATVGVVFPAMGGKSDLARQCAGDFHLALSTLRKQIYNETHAQELIKVDESFELAEDEVFEIGGSGFKSKKKKASSSSSASSSAGGGSGLTLLSGPPGDGGGEGSGSKKKKKSKKSKKKKAKDDGVAAPADPSSAAVIHAAQAQAQAAATAAAPGAPGPATEDDFGDFADFGATDADFDF